MIENNIEMIYDISAGRIREVDLTFHRFLYSQIDWDSRLVALDGPRGVGKTTMFLQYLHDNPKESGSTLYLSLDNIWLSLCCRRDYLRDLFFFRPCFLKSSSDGIFQ